MLFIPRLKQEKKEITVKKAKKGETLFENIVIILIIGLIISILFYFSQMDNSGTIDDLFIGSTIETMLEKNEKGMIFVLALVNGNAQILTLTSEEAKMLKEHGRLKVVEDGGKKLLLPLPPTTPTETGKKE